MASKHFVLRIHTEPQKPHKGDKGHDNSCHTYHAYVYICLYLSMSLSIRVCRLSAMWPPFLFLGAALRARLLPPCSKGGPIETLRTTETENQRLLRIIFCYHIHKNQWTTRVDALLSRNTFPFPYGKPKFGTRFDGIRFQLRYCGAGELVVQMTCDCQNVVRHNERKLNRLSAFHFFIYTSQLWTFKIPSNKYAPVNMCFMTSYATYIPDTSWRCCLADKGPIHHHPLGFKQHSF